MSAENLYFLKSGIAERIQAFLLRALNDHCKDGVNFVQVGANDGRTHDPLSHMVRSQKWRGVLFEPVPIFFERLQANYAGVEGLTFVQKACSNVAGKLAFYQVKNVDRMPHDFMRGLSTFNRNLIARHFTTSEAWDMFVEEVAVDVVTIDQTLSALSIEQVDLLQIDAEGSDLLVLAGFDLDRYLPKLLMLETMHLPLVEQHALWERMAALGYERAIGALDSFFVQREILSSHERDLLSQFRYPVLAVS